MEDGTERELRLDQYLKIQGWVQSGGHAKLVIQGGEVSVNGAVETRRRRKLSAGDRVEYDGRTGVVSEEATRG